MAALTAWKQNWTVVPWTSVTGKGATLCMKAQGDHPLPCSWDHGVQSKAGLGWTWAGCGAQRTAAFPPSLSPGPHPFSGPFQRAQLTAASWVQMKFMTQPESRRTRPGSLDPEEVHPPDCVSGASPGNQPPASHDRGLPTGRPQQKLMQKLCA